MAVGISSLSQICRAFSDYVADGINHPADTRIDVVLGTPGAAQPAEADSHRLNLFFFRFEPSGFDPDLLPGENWLLRMHCLATPFCVDEGGVLAGENDLRVIGELLRLIHEQPVIEVSSGDESFLLQIIFQTLGLDQLNQIWSTQNDTIYRPSLLLEVSLAPVIPDVAAIEAPRVGGIGVEVRGCIDAGAATITAQAPAVPVMQPNTDGEAWEPVLCLVSDGVCLLSASMAVGSPELAAFAPQAWVAGLAGSTVDLRWEIWDASEGWRPGGASVPIAITDARIDPDDVAGATTHAVALPFTDHAGQMALYAERSYARAADGVTITVRSNTVLISLYEVAP